MKHVEKTSVSHEERLIEELRTDPEFAHEYLVAAMEEEIPVMLVALRQLAEACGGMTKVAEDAGIAREALYRALSPKGNPTLKTFTAVLKAIGMRLDVAPLGQKERKAA
jgi:probable addiction module antidote protein